MDETSARTSALTQLRQDNRDTVMRLLTELGGVELSAEAVSSVLVDLLAPCCESMELAELFFERKLACEWEMRRHAFANEGIIGDEVAVVC